jgi:hypothetical protein
MLQKLTKIKADQMVKERLLSYLAQKKPINEALLKNASLKDLERLIKASKLISPML